MPRNSGIFSTGATIRRLATVWFVVVSVLAGFATPGHSDDGKATIVLYDPSTNHQAVDQILRWFNRYLAASLPGHEFAVVTKPEVFRKLLDQKSTAYAMVSSSLLELDHGVGLSPMLVPTSEGAQTFRKVLVDLGEGSAKDLAGKRIATVLAAGEPESGLRKVLEAGGVTVKGALILRLSKDLDALLAINFGQAQAALVAESSLGVFRKMSPATAGKMRVLWKSEPIMRPPLCAVEGRQTEAQREALRQAILRMSQSEQGRKAMLSLGFDGWAQSPAAREG